MNIDDIFERYTIADICQEIANRGHQVMIDNVVYEKGETKATNKQLKLIETIKDELGIMFEGSTITEAAEFIKLNLPFMSNITQKQRGFIDSISSTLSIEFKGKTKEDAKEFISDNLNAYNSKRSCRNDFGNSSFEREDYCGISPYDVYDEYDMPAPF